MSRSITLFSSARRNGNTGKLIDSVAQNSTMKIVDLNKANISPFDYDHNNKDDDFIPLIEEVLTYDTIIFATPVYWYSVSPSLKVFLDRITDLLTQPDLLYMGRALRGKNGFVVSTSASQELSSTFIEVFMKTFDYLGVNYRGCLHINCSDELNLEQNKDEIRLFSKRI